MSGIYEDDPVMRRVEEIAQAYADEHAHQPVTEERAAQLWDVAPPRPKRYTGRRRANEDGTPSLAHIRTVADLLGDYRCPWPDEHAVDYPDGPVAWMQHRKDTGECATCKGRVR